MILSVIVVVTKERLRGGFDETISENPQAIVDAYVAVENIMFDFDTVLRQSTYKVVFDLAERGGLDTCDEDNGYKYIFKDRAPCITYISKNDLKEYLESHIKDAFFNIYQPTATNARLEHRARTFPSTTLYSIEPLEFNPLTVKVTTDEFILVDNLDPQLFYRHPKPTSVQSIDFNAERNQDIMFLLLQEVDPFKTCLGIAQPNGIDDIEVARCISRHFVVPAREDKFDLKGNKEPGTFNGIVRFTITDTSQKYLDYSSKKFKNPTYKYLIDLSNP
jgi:hypothetical protein